MEKLIITAAICGAEVTKEQNPAVPYTVEEMVREAKSAYEAGAAILHIHVREDDGHLRHLFRGKPGFGKDPADIPKHGEGLFIAAGVVDAPRFGVLGHLPGQEEPAVLEGHA